ncbi:mitR domain protein [Mycobacterium xenopi 3993]|nr:mitR domain protein [Mycobacterium xenopi 3993]
MPRFPPGRRRGEPHFPAQAFAQVLVGWQNWLRTADRSSWALADATAEATGTHCRILATVPAAR